jgi:hypothetical protein
VPMSNIVGSMHPPGRRKAHRGRLHQERIETWPSHGPLLRRGRAHDGTTSSTRLWIRPVHRRPWRHYGREARCQVIPCRGNTKKQS